MKSRLALILFGIGVFLVAAVLYAPMDRLYGWIAPRLAASPAALHGVGGTLKDGHATRLDWNRQPVLNDLAWQLRPLYLLLGRASFDLSGGGQGTLVAGRVSAVPSGTLTVSGLQFTAPLEILLRLIGDAQLPVQGQAGLQMDHLRIRRQWPDRATGTLTVRGLGWKLGRDPVILGDYQAVVDNETAGIRAQFSTLAGVLDVTGEARLMHDRRYELNLQMRPKPDAPPLVPNLIRNLGQPDAQGWYHLRRQGTAAPPAEGP